jgi:hypothetical protein
MAWGIVVRAIGRRGLDRLEKGEPITFPGEDVGIEGVEFLIFSGETEQAMQRSLANLVGPATEGA